MEDNIKVVDIEFDDLINAKEVARQLGMDYREALVLLSKQIIPSVRVNGFYTKKSLLEKYINSRKVRSL